ncbi:MAG: hypothetical protein V4508_00625 [Pseudomonadota bacterium]
MSNLNESEINVKNIQVIDGAINCVYDIFSATEEEYSLIFPSGTDIAFIDEVYKYGNSQLLDIAFSNIWKRRVRKCEALGIHGIVFYELNEKIIYYPSRRDDEAINPDGSSLR